MIRHDLPVCGFPSDPELSSLRKAAAAKMEAELCQHLANGSAGQVFTLVI